MNGVWQSRCKLVNCPIMAKANGCGPYQQQHIFKKKKKKHLKFQQKNHNNKPQHKTHLRNSVRRHIDVIGGARSRVLPDSVFDRVATVESLFEVAGELFGVGHAGDEVEVVDDGRVGHRHGRGIVPHL